MRSIKGTREMGNENKINNGSCKEEPICGKYRQ
jgi:hypothetical protein